MLAEQENRTTPTARKALDQGDLRIISLAAERQRLAEIEEIAAFFRACGMEN